MKIGIIISVVIVVMMMLIMVVVFIFVFCCECSFVVNVWIVVGLMGLVRGWVLNVEVGVGWFIG